MKDSQDELEKYLSAGKPAPKNFGEAFNQARDRKQKTFYYKGKLYTTELAGSKNPASSPSPSPSPSPAASKPPIQASAQDSEVPDVDEIRAQSARSGTGTSARERLESGSLDLLHKALAVPAFGAAGAGAGYGAKKALDYIRKLKSAPSAGSADRREPSFKSKFPTPKSRSERSLGPSDDELDIIRLGSDFAAKKGGKVKSTYKQGGKVSSASKRADGAAQRGKTRGKYI